MKKRIVNEKLLNKVVFLIACFVIVTSVFFYFARPIATNSYFTYESELYDYNITQD